MERSLKSSLCFGLFDGGEQIGLARVISDFATFAYLCDVYVLDAYQGQGLGTWLLQSVVSHPDLQNLRRWMLATRDAHGLYRKVGFTELHTPERWMELFTPHAKGQGYVSEEPRSFRSHAMVRRRAASGATIS